jgi:TIR domain
MSVSVRRLTHHVPFMALTPSHRITVIREIAQRLKKDDWSLIDLTLRQFGLPVTETWHGEKSDYVIEMIQGGQAADLIELARHLGFQLQKTSTSPDPSFWKDGMLRLFISHLAKHRSFAAQLQGSLIDFGICGFVAHSDIEPTEEWQTAIETALVTCDALVTLLHPEFHRSNWTDQEIGFAMGRGLPVFSVRLGQDPYGFIGRFQAFDGKNNTADVLAAELFVAYRKNKQTQGKMADSLVAYSRRAIVSQPPGNVSVTSKS